MEEVSKNIKQHFYGACSEALAMFFYLSKFWQVYSPVEEHGRVDMVVQDLDGNMHKVQVKKAKFVVCGAYGHKYLQCGTGYDQENKCCYYDLLVVVHGDRIWEIPACEISKITIILDNDFDRSTVDYRWDKYLNTVSFEST